MNIKKIGLSALAGSLAVVSANAVELSVSGKTEVTYAKKDTGSNGNPFGMGNALTFSGSGDVNGMTATYTAVIGDGGQANSNTSETFASSSPLVASMLIKMCLTHDWFSTLVPVTFPKNMMSFSL